MESKELYQCLPGLNQPWAVERVELEMAKMRVEVYVDHPSGTRFACPESGQACGGYDHLAERSWRHLDSCQFLTCLHAKPPGISCPEHGVRQAWHLMERAVLRGHAAKVDALPKKIGIDEKAIAKGHRYMTLVCDLEAATVEYIGEERTEASLTAYCTAFTEKQRAGIEAISLDMWPAYINACTAQVPQAEDKMVFDCFHIMQHVGSGVDRVRKDEHKALLQEGNDTLKRSKYLWLYSAENMPAAARERFDQIKHGNLKTARAWALKESLREMWSYRSRGQGKTFLGPAGISGLRIAGWRL